MIKRISTQNELVLIKLSIFYNVNWLNYLSFYDFVLIYEIRYIVITLFFFEKIISKHVKTLLLIYSSITQVTFSSPLPRL